MQVCATFFSAAEPCVSHTQRYLHRDSLERTYMHIQIHTHSLSSRRANKHMCHCGHNSHPSGKLMTISKAPPRLEIPPPDKPELLIRAPLVRCSTHDGLSSSDESPESPAPAPVLAALHPRVSRLDAEFDARFKLLEEIGSGFFGHVRSRCEQRSSVETFSKPSASHCVACLRRSAAVMIPRPATSWLSSLSSPRESATLQVASAALICFVEC